MSASSRRAHRPGAAAGSAEAETAAPHREAPTLRELTRTRLHELGIRPNRELGQNFLVDGRYLAVVEAAAQLAPSDAVLEVGGGLGVLSERLAPRVGHLHVVELDRLLASVLETSVATLPNSSLHVADAVGLDFAALRPSPTKLVANLPYGVAATVVLKSLEELPGMELGVAMVQREVAERFAAAPGSRIYGATSVLAQLSCQVRVHRRVPRGAFLPAPNVDSAIVVLERRSASPGPEVRGLIRAAFAHRRKTLAGSLALATGASPAVRERARAALVTLGHPADARAERLAPSDFVALSALLENASGDAGGSSGPDGPVARGRPG